LAEQEGVHFVGRLATYKYYNMDQVVAQALTLYARICNVSRAEALQLYYAAPLPTVTFPGVVKRKRPRTLANRRRAVLEPS
jgi:hypothetical protein